MIFNGRCILTFAFAVLGFLVHESLAQEEETTATAAASGNNSTINNPYLQDHVERLFAILNGVEEIYNETEYVERFTPFFVEQLPLETAFVPILENLQETADEWEILQVIDTSSSNPNAAILVIAPTDTGEPKLLLSMSVDPSTTNHQVNGLRFQPAETPQLENPPETVQEAVYQLMALGHFFHYLIADVDHQGGGGSSDNPQCSTLAGEGVDTPAPLGSMFKFWVLGAVVDAVQDNTIGWDDLVTVTEESKSLPSGIVQDDPTGSSNRTVREMAELMISISDNTATDLLIDLVGREKVEAALEVYGHSNHQLNIPFLKTKELFVLKLDGAVGDGQPGPLGQDYILEEEVDGRRDILDSIQNTTIGSYGLNPAEAWAGGPIAIEELEWFGSPIDLCNVLVKLYRNDEAARILAINPGLPDPQGLWSYIGFKGGSELGVLGMAWYLIPATNTDNNDTTTQAAAHHRVVTATLWDPTTAINEVQASLLMGYLRDLSLGDEELMTTATQSNNEEEEKDEHENGATTASTATTTSTGDSSTTATDEEDNSPTSPSAPPLEEESLEPAKAEATTTTTETIDEGEIEDMSSSSSSGSVATASARLLFPATAVSSCFLAVFYLLLL